MSVSFGQRDGIKQGHVVMSINGKQAQGRKLIDGSDIFEVSFLLVFNLII